MVLVDWYAPGFRAGGPIRSAVNFVDQLENEMEIFVLTSDRDLGEQHAYTNIQVDKWISNNHHQIFYASPGKLSWHTIKEFILTINPDYIYLNSMFSLYFSIYPLLMNRMGKLNSQLILAPRGMLRVSALMHKSGKKRVFLSLFRTLGLYKDIVFQATDETEFSDIRNNIGNNASIFTVGNLPGKQIQMDRIPVKEKGALKMVFIGRIHPIKNLDFLLRALSAVEGKVELTIITTLEDQVYWKKCQSLIEQLPSSIEIRLLENIPHEKVREYISLNHILALPTKGENFGHAIFESLAAGRPVLISDQTPWRNLESVKAGWDIPIDKEKNFTEKIQQLVQMDMEAISSWCTGAWNHAYAYLHQSEIKQAYLNQFK